MEWNVDIHVAWCMIVQFRSLTSRTNFSPLIKLSKLFAASKVVKTTLKLEITLVLGHCIVIFERSQHVNSKTAVKYIYYEIGSGVQGLKLYHLWVGPGNVLVCKGCHQMSPIVVNLRVWESSVDTQQTVVSLFCCGIIVSLAMFFGSEGVSGVKVSSNDTWRL